MKAPLSLGLITLGEPTLERAVASVREHVKQIVIVYTGADEKTADRVEKLADAFDWVMAPQDDADFDFSWARNLTQKLSTEPAYTWMDSDDTVIGAENMGRICEALRSGERILCDYLYWHDPDTGLCTLRQHRERFVLNDGQFYWKHPVHEGLVHREGQQIDIHNGWVTWKHHRSDDGKASHERNLKILNRYVEKHGADTWANYQLGHALADLGEGEKAVECFRAYLADSGRDDERALACMRLSQLMGSVGALGNSVHWTLEALKYVPDYFDALLAMARIRLVQGICNLGDEKDIRDALEWCEKAAAAPTTSVLPTNPSARGAVYEVVAQCYENLLDEEAQSKALDRAVEIDPSSPRLALMRRNLQGWQRAPGCLDIAFACGATQEPWNPRRAAHQGIGGSETAVIEVSKRLAAKGHRCRVYTSCGTEGMYDGVEYHDSMHLTELDEVDVLVVWRMAPLIETVPAKVKWIDVHDVEIHGATQYRLSCADRVLAKSKWHRDWLLEKYGEMGLREEQVTTIRNGIDLDRFAWGDAKRVGPPGNYIVTWRDLPERNPKRAVYSSSPDRGLEVLLDLWPRIREQVPDAELSVFYGRQGLAHATRFEERIAKALASAEGVTDHGRVNQVELARHMLGAGAWLYPSIFTLSDPHQEWHETFCIGAIEAAAAGLHIVSGDWGALTETVRGTRLGGNFSSEEWRSAFVEHSVKALTRADDEVREKVAGIVRRKYGWDGVVDEWIEMMASDVGRMEAAQ